MGSTLLVHIGMPKTGTTALQNFLYENQGNLRDYGWCYPDLQRELSEITFRPGRAYINGAVFYKAKKQKANGVSHRIEGNLIVNTQEWNSIWKLILKYLRDKNVVISEELLWNDAERFLRKAKEKYEVIKVVVYLRRQDKAIESFWNQQIKYRYGAYTTESFEEYVCLYGDEYHYLEKLEQLSKVIGKENLIVRVYEKEQLRGNNAIASDFLSILGIDPDWKRWKKCQTLNWGLSGNYIELKRVANSIQFAGYISPPEVRRIFTELSHTFSKEIGGYFSLLERKVFMERFVLENEKIAREYLDREDGILFYDNEMDIPKQEMHQSSSFEEDFIRFFMAMLCNQTGEIEHLKECNFRNAERWLSVYNIKGKKMLLFGAGQKCNLLLEYLKLPVTLIADNDEKLKGKRLKGVPIAWAEEIENWKEYFVIITCAKTNEIEEQLHKLGLKKEENYVLAKEYFACY